MNQHDAQLMQNYPDPTAVTAESNGPFYSPNNGTQQRQLSNPDDLQLAAQLSRGLEPMMENGGQQLQIQDNLPSQPQSHSPQNAPQHSFDHQQQMMEMGQNMDPNPQQGHEQQHSPYPMSNQDQTAPRKRSKVSRACDECRRKKIRCDATTESGEEQCSSCKRVGTTCQFSRVPMKRGPSKG
jgi:hypothetical protein